MRKQRLVLASLVAAAASLLWAAELPLEPHHDSGQSITAAYEGWFQNPDGSFSILLGYYNRNLKQDLDIPVGPNNRIEPGGPDQGQPTLFLAGRQWGIFTVKVPKDFGSNKITWTIVANGQPTSVPFSLDPLWVITPLVDASNNTPPFISFEPGRATNQGPRPLTVERTAILGNPLALPVWVADDAKVPPGALTSRTRGTPVTLSWSKFRGPGEVSFENARPSIEKADWDAPPPAVYTGKATTSAVFSEPGEYVLRAVANDISGDGGRGFQCCWTNVLVKVLVQQGTAGDR
jgi:hypothetical protein